MKTPETVVETAQETPVERVVHILREGAVRGPLNELKRLFGADEGVVITHDTVRYSGLENPKNIELSAQFGIRVLAKEDGIGRACLKEVRRQAANMVRLEEISRHAGVLQKVVEKGVEVVIRSGGAVVQHATPRTRV